MLNIFLIEIEQKKLVMEFAKVIETLLNQAVSLTELKHLAEYDSLTQLFTRGAVLSRLQHEFDCFKRYQASLSIIFLDIDHFKRINDNLGHASGDKVLKKIANVLQNSLRQSDFIGRLGGEEFLICMCDTKRNGAGHQADRIRMLIEDMEIALNSQQYSVTVSCGVTEVLDDDSNIEKLVARADEALYMAKNGGRNKVVIL